MPKENKSQIVKEMRSGALKEIVIGIQEIDALLKSKTITPHEAAIRLKMQKHMIQAVALDWLYNKMPGAPRPKALPGN